MRIKSALLGAICSYAVLCNTAYAQEDGSEGDDIIVTARKRQESILKVPVIASVVTEAQIERNQVTTLTDIASLTTGVALGQQPGELGTQISIRGVGTSSIDPGVDQSVSLNLDGLQLSQGMAYSVGLFDMAQVEVLKGPQALFFGKNSPGGVVSIRTADPGDELEVIGRLGYEFEARNWRGEAIISSPVSETLGVRLAAMYSDNGGFFRNTATALPGTGAIDPPNRFGLSKTLFLRGTAVYKPTSDFSARLKVNYTRDRQKWTTGYQVVSCPDGTDNYAGPPFLFFAPNEQCKQDREINYVGMEPGVYGDGLRNNGVPFTNITQKFGTLELNYDLQPDLTLTSVTGYYNLETEAMWNGTSTGYAGPAIAADKSFRRREFTQELRLNSDFDGRLNFSAGGFYQDGNMKNAVALPSNTLYGFPPFFFKGTHDVDIKSISLFGQLRYKLIDTLEISGGVRWTDERRSNDPTTVDVFGPVNAVLHPHVPDLKSSNFAPELTITYTPTDDLTIFGSLKQGYKSGSYNLSAPVNPGTENAFGDEKVQGGEIGLKSRLADRQLFVNVAGYFYKYTGLQVGVNLSETVVVLKTLNAGSAEVYGVDFDFDYRPASIEGLGIRGGVNYNHAQFTKFEDAPCWGGQTIADGCNQVFNDATGLFTAQDLSGTSPMRAPRWQAILGVNYELPTKSGMKIGFGADSQYSSKYLAQLGRRSDFFQDGFLKLSANITLKDENGAWEAALIGNNLTNKLRSGNCVASNYAGGGVLPGIVSGGTTRGPAGSDELICIVDPGREVWLRLTLRPSAF